MKHVTLILLLVTTTYLQAQNDSTTFLKGKFITGGFDGMNNFNIYAIDRGSGPVSFSNREVHTFAAYLGFGFYYRKNKALLLQANTQIDYDNYYQTKRWNNSFGITLTKMNFKNLYKNKILTSINQNLGGTMSYTREYEKYRSTPWYNPSNKYNEIRYTLSTSLFYKYNNAIAVQLSLPLFSVFLSKSNNYDLRGNLVNSTTAYSYRTSFYYSINNIKIGVLWSPSFIQSKKK